MGSDMARYRRLFLEEGHNHLQAVETCLLDGAHLPPEGLDRVFREIHSLKGMASSMGYESMADLAHRLEDLLDRWRTEAADLTEDQRALCLRVCDRLGEMRLDIAEGGGGDLDWADLEPLLRLPAVPPSVGETDDGGLLEVRIRLAADCASPAARAYLILLRCKEICPQATAAPPEADLMQGVELRELTLFLPEVSRNEMERLYETFTEVEELHFPDGASSVPDGPSPGDTGSPEGSETPPAPGSEQPAAEAPKVRLPDAVQAPVQLLDEFVDLLGEMTIARSHLEDTARTLGSEILREEVDALGKLVRSFHSRVMRLRMLPFSTITGSLKRLVKEHAASLDKEVDLRIEGEEIGLDKSILLQISDPLLHLLRNALDHGIETVVERQHSGKPSTGVIEIIVSRARNRVEIAVRDDGQGVDSEVIRRKAVERGVFREEQSRGLSPSEVLSCLFRPGFSTREEVSSLSGRGVGLDVVKSRLDALGGAIEISSRVGHGTEFRLSMPLSVAIVPVLMVEVAGSVLALPTSIVVKTVEAQPRDVRSQEGNHVLLTESGQVPIVSLGRVLKLGGRRKFQRLPLVLIHHRGGEAALAVDRFINEEDLFIKPLRGPLKAFRGISGYSVLGDGRLVFLIDPPTLFQV